MENNDKEKIKLLQSLMDKKSESITNSRTRVFEYEYIPTQTIYASVRIDNSGGVING
jgi:hypothetical protein